jgi:hypothetical protein
MAAVAIAAAEVPAQPAKRTELSRWSLFYGRPRTLERKRLAPGRHIDPVPSWEETLEKLLLSLRDELAQ